MKKAALILVAVAMMAAPAYASEETETALSSLISSVAELGAETGAVCALEEARDIGHVLTPEEANDHMWECIHARLDAANLGPDTAINMVKERK